MLDRVPDSIRPIYRFATSIFPDWRDTWILTAKKTENWAPNLEISKEEFDDIMLKTTIEQRKKGRLF